MHDSVTDADRQEIRRAPVGRRETGGAPPTAGVEEPREPGHLQENSPRLQFGNLQLASRFTLAPLAGYTTLAFRRAIRELGPLGLVTTDLVNARAILRGSRKTLDLLETCPKDSPLAVQIYGSDAEEMRAAAQWLEQYGVAVVDINMGCPVHKVTRNGGGSALLCEPHGAVKLVERVVEGVRLPVTVKMRLGWDDQHWSAPAFAREFEQVGVAAVTIHGRTREQGFGGHVKLDGIRAVVEAVDRLPVIGNGDVRTLADADDMLNTTGCAGIAIGRGALLNPWIFAQLHAREVGRADAPAASFSSRLQFMERHFSLLVEQRGERFGCLTFRKVANWYSRRLRPPRHLHDELMRLDSIARFAAIVEELRQKAPLPANGEDRESEHSSIHVPSGPIEHW